MIWSGFHCFSLSRCCCPEHQVLLCVRWFRCVHQAAILLRLSFGLGDVGLLRSVSPAPAYRCCACSLEQRLPFPLLPVGPPLSLRGVDLWTCSRGTRPRRPPPRIRLLLAALAAPRSSPAWPRQPRPPQTYQRLPAAGSPRRGGRASPRAHHYGPKRFA